jgi:glycosyltransferase involved in cell wall biosynthesis
MRVLHVTNLVSPHQLPLARQLAAGVGESNFRLAATLPMTVAMGKRGWRNDEAFPWILLAGENESHRAEFAQWWDDADVVLSGNRNVVGFADRMRRKKLTFYASERWWKPPLGMARLLHPRFSWMAYQFCRLAQSPCFHYLPMGGYAATDMRWIAAFQGRTWDWGYFTAVPDPLPKCLACDGTLRILWAGRMLAWKRVDTLIRAFAVLVGQKTKTHLTLIGDGPCRRELERLTLKLGLANNVEFHASMLAGQVREQMRKAHVYVLPSNAYEGWGAVLNEAMSEGCAAVASDGAGAAKTMLRHGENGLLFTLGDHRGLAELLVQLSADELLRLRLAKAGQKTISDCWSPDVAAERFLAVADALLSKRSVPEYASGPMARVGR